MPKSPEQYQPSEEEIKKAEDAMTSEEKDSSKEREETIEYGRKKEREESDSEKSKEIVHKAEIVKSPAIKTEVIKPKEEISHKFIQTGVGAGIRASYINEIKNSAFIKNVKIGINETKTPRGSTFRIELRGNRNDVVAVKEDIDNIAQEFHKRAKKITKGLFG